MAVNFTPKEDKPHIKMYSMGIYHKTYFLLTSSGCKKALDYCERVNPMVYSTPGEAARALHYGSEK